MKRYHPLAFALLFNLAFAAAPGDERALVAQARQITHDLNAKLKQTLKEVLDKEGTVQAVETCHIKAPDIVADAGRNGWEVRRTSLKVRNLEDAPDKWESSVLEMFEARNEEGEPVSKLEKWTVTSKDGRKVFRYMKAIPVRKVCLRCHGDKIDRHVAKQLDSLYPFDQARGYTGGEIRGAFSLYKPLD